MSGWPTKDLELESEKERAALEEEIRAQGPCGVSGEMGQERTTRVTNTAERSGERKRVDH